MKPVYDPISKTFFCVPLISHDELISHYGSLTIYKQFLTSGYENYLLHMGQQMLESMEQVPPTILVFSRQPERSMFDIMHLDVRILFAPGIPRDAIPITLRHTIHNDMARFTKEGSKIYGTAFYSEAWMKKQVVAAEQKNVDIKIPLRQDPDRLECLNIQLDFIYFDTELTFQLSRPAGRKPTFEKMPGLSNLFPEETNVRRGGHLHGLLRRAADIYELEDDTKFNRIYKK